MTNLKTQIWTTQKSNYDNSKTQIVTNPKLKW